MKNKIVIADSGPLIAFAKIECLNLLANLFEKVIIPLQVANECLIDMGKPGAKAIEEAISSKSIAIYEDDINPDPDVSEFLGEGESAAITLAIKLNSFLLIDDKHGRSIAKDKDIKVIGTAGILLKAKEKKLIENVAPLISNLHNEGYFFSEVLVKEILKIAHEQPINLFELNNFNK